LVDNSLVGSFSLEEGNHYGVTELYLKITISTKSFHPNC
jgi:uncharacterized protein YheU (UPF0270 family)